MDVFSALADANRRKIIELLAKNGSLTSSDIAEHFKISAPAISQHLKVLKEAKVVMMEKNAQQRIYQINTAKFNELEKWIKKLTELWDERFSALDKLLEKQKIASNKHQNTNKF